MHSRAAPIKEIVKEAGSIAVATRKAGLEVQYKQDKSPVTNADKKVSDFIYGKLAGVVLEEIICEERDNRPLQDTKNFWLIDPIDGTRSFLKGEETYTINIACIKEGIPKIGFIYQPATDKLYYTDEDGGLIVEQNGAIVETKAGSEKDKFTAVIGSHYFGKLTKHFLKNQFIDEVLTIPSSIKLCLIAEGRADIYPRFGKTMEWDTAAGHALILAGGGDILDLEGNSLAYAKAGFENPHFFAVSYNWIKRLPIL